jgi:ComF family protein
VSKAPICAACTEALRQQAVPGVRDADGISWIAAFEYREPVRSMIHRAKYRAAVPALHALAGIAASRVAHATRFDGAVIVPVPLGPRRRRQRGYNQADVVAHAFAAARGARTMPGLVRLRDTQPQAEKNESQRQRNVDGAFTWRGGLIDGEHLCLVDDVVTTGATVRAAAEALRAAGAGDLMAASLASVP